MQMTLGKNSAVLALVCALTVALVGCGSSGGGSRSGLVKASGILTYNGQPVDGATLDFRPMDESVQNGVAAGFTDEKGMFSLMTDRPGDGALPGKYRVTVKKQVEMIDKQNQETPDDPALGPKDSIEDSDINTYIALVEHIDRKIANYPAIMNVVKEEAAAYFADQRSVDDVCAIIQNRVKLILQESQ